jgi:hypothetical protein
MNDKKFSEAEKLVSGNESPVGLFFKAQMLMIQGKKEEALKLLIEKGNEVLYSSKNFVDFLIQASQLMKNEELVNLVVNKLRSLKDLPLEA